MRPYNGGPFMEARTAENSKGVDFCPPPCIMIGIRIISPDWPDR